MKLHSGADGMTKSVDFYFALQSPWAHLGGKLLTEIAARHDLTVRAKPVDLGSIFPKSGGLPLAKRAPQRQAYRMTELKRWSAYRGVDVVLEPVHFPTDPTLGSCMIIAASLAGQDALALSCALLAITWMDDRNVADPADLIAAADAAGFDGAHLVEQAQSDSAKSGYEAVTQEAFDKGVFGSPTYVYQGELFWGQDRLEFLERAIA